MDAAVRQRLDNNPTWYYKPSSPSIDRPNRGQLNFHQATQGIRFLCPGNGWGKTISMGHEVEAWMTHSNRWRITPARRITALWFPADYKQFAILLELLREKCWGQVPIWKPHDNHSLIWPDGSTLYVVPQDRTWTKVQGGAIDLALFDEHPPLKLFSEVYARRRGGKKTEIIIAATMTRGMTWEHKHIYKKWLDFHANLGLSEYDAMVMQKHPDIFCWPRGGILDNPSMTDADHYHMHEAMVYSSEKEKLVRTAGGFQDWSGDAVFGEEGVAWMREQMARVERERPTVVKAGTFRIREPK